jgi:hypothetical protein
MKKEADNELETERIHLYAFALYHYQLRLSLLKLRYILQPGGL